MKENELGRKWRLTADLHTHTKFSHGADNAEDNVRAALRAGLQTVAICDHGPGHMAYGVRRMEAYLREMDRLKTAYAGSIRVLAGIELNLCGLEGQTDLPDALRDAFDLRLLGYHKFVRMHGLRAWSYLYAGRGDVRRNTDALLAAAESAKAHVLVHPGYGLAIDAGRVARFCAGRGVLFEINNKHTELDVEQLRCAGRAGARFVLSSDAHAAAHVGGCMQAMQKAAAAGITLDQLENVTVKGE